MKKILFLCAALAITASVIAQNNPVRKYMQNNQGKVNPAVDRSDFITPSGKLPTFNQTTYPKGVLLFENANIVTHAGQGAGGADFSWAWDDNTWGLAAHIADDFSLAVNFDIIDASWTIDSVRIYAYQTNSGTTSTLTDVRIRIWDGTPYQTTSTVIWGDLTTNVMASTRFTNCYRGTDFASIARPIMVAICNTPALTLTQGFDYWIEFSLGGTSASGPWVPPIVTGSDMQYDGTNAYVTDHEFPVDIFGDAVAASCPTASNIMVTNIEDISATIAWTENGAASTWLIEYGPSGFTPGTLTPVVTTTNPHNLTGLTAGTAYDVTIRAFCTVGDTSIYSQSKTFTTLNCPSADLCEYTFDLTDDWGDGWNGAAIEIRVNSVLDQTITMANGATLSLPVFICDNANVTLTWVSGDYDEECGLVVKDPYGTVLYSFGFNSAPNAGAVFHTFTTNCSSTCFPPTNLTASGITLTSANLNWTDNAGATTWDIEWGVAPFTQGNGTMVNGTSTKPYALTGLNPTTTYAFYVRAICGTDNSPWAGPFTFSTLCNPITTFPWAESFEGAVFPPSCWANIDADGDTYKWERRDEAGWPAQHGTAVAVSASWVNPNPVTPDNYLVTPALTINNPNLELSFWVAAQDNDFPAEKYSVMASTTGSSAADFTTTLHTQVLSSNVFQKVTLPLSAYNGQTIYIAFRHWDCTDEFYIKIDNVKIEAPSSINDNALENSVKVYPNPAQNFLNISATQNINNVRIINALGQVVNYSQVNALNFTINTADYKFGIYFIEIETIEGKVNKRFVIAE